MTPVRTTCPYCGEITHLATSAWERFMWGRRRPKQEFLDYAAD